MTCTKTPRVRTRHLSCAGEEPTARRALDESKVWSLERLWPLAASMLDDSKSGFSQLSYMYIIIKKLHNKINIKQFDLMYNYKRRVCILKSPVCKPRRTCASMWVLSKTVVVWSCEVQLANTITISKRMYNTIPRIFFTIL